MNQKTLMGWGVLVGVVLPGAVLAQGFDVQLLRPNPDLTEPYFVTGSAHPGTLGDFSAGLFLDFAKEPFVLYGADGKRLAALVDHQLTAHLVGAYYFADRLSVGIAAPMVLAQSGEGPDYVPNAKGAGFGIGDLRVVPRMVLFTETAEPTDPTGFALAGEVEFFVPTGSKADFQGEGFRFAPRVLAEYVLPSGIRLGSSLSYLVRPKTEILNLTVNDMVTWSLGTSVPMTERLSATGELHGEVSVLAKAIHAEEVPTELLAGGKYRLTPVVTMLFGSGVGLVDGAGAPDWRVFGGATFNMVTEPLPKDRDGDGLLDNVDQCPDDPEDKDSFEDADGCPDPDNDQDKILDVSDSCPNDPEDLDGFEDQEGCPDPDNDRDGIVDVKDSCPMEPEDLDKFEDENGCPDPDNDQDKILDVNDSCPNEPEDVDGFEDQDGCPDPDNDKDQIGDPVDKCPDEPEVFNGFEDDDGCPDKGGKLLLTCAKLEVHEKVYFDTAKATIQQRSYPLLNQVAAVLAQAKNIKKVRIEGHTDDRGSDAYNLDLSKNRAASVRDYLVSHGIEEGRLDSEGFGEMRPIASNKTERGREQNRRVEFFIVEQEESAACKEAGAASVTPQ